MGARGEFTRSATQLIAPDGCSTYVVDSKWWSQEYPVRVTRYDRLVHGTSDRHRSVTTAAWTARRVEQELGIWVRPLIAIHGAWVTGGQPKTGGVLVIPVRKLLERLEAGAAKTRPAPGAARSVRLQATRAFPPASHRTH